jgi:transcriptional regulator with XRE-family HTH domain
MELGERLRRIRIKKNLSLREAAERIGVSHTYLNSLEKGMHPQTGKPVNPSAKTLRGISKAYGIPIEELLVTDEEVDGIADIAEDIRNLRPADRDAIIHLVRRLRNG